MAMVGHVIFQEEESILYHGSNHDIIPRFPDSCLDIVITSPPYNTGMVGNAKIKPSGFRKEFSMAKNLHKMTSGYRDTLPEEEYQQQQVDLLNALYRVMKPHGSVMYNHKIRWRDKYMIHPMDWVRKSKFNLRMEIVWDRGVGLTLNARRPYDQDERIYWLYKDSWIWNQSAVGIGSVWRITPQAFKQHSCVFPEKLVANCLEMVSRPGMVVCDPYAGSGTVLAVAKKYGCFGIGIEQNADYCRVIIDRLRQQPTLPMFTAQAVQRSFTEED
jgi:site-specific DNA-methyltransferase (adenine-specific)